ncbi:MAG: GTP-binding protein [Candidatus Lokiarchaeota archaeon]|nr:GTP-binding protein [Candidatus Lokiarchaeota archaeon]
MENYRKPFSRLNSLSRAPIIKVFLCGEGGVGKTTLIERLIRGVFNANTIITIGVQHSLYKIKTPKGKEIRLQIWDLGGEERFKVILPIYVKGSAGGLIVFDESRYPTFRNLPEWIKLVKKSVDPDASLLLVSTKADLVDKQRISDEKMKEFLEKHGFRDYIRTSSKDGLNIEAAFKKLVQYFEEDGKI